MLFKNEDVFKPISLLSGGEKARVALCKLSLGGHNVLLLDEPTNHLDMDSREVLEDALKEFNGTLIVISHDRYFINKLADTIWVLENRKIMEYKGNYDQYQEQLKQQQAPVEEKGITKTQEIKQKKKEKQIRDEIKQQKQRLTLTEKEISATEEEIIKIERLFTDPATYEQTDRVNELNARYKQYKDQLEELYIRWEELSNNLDA